MNTSSAFDTHKELLVQPFKQGVRLVKPESAQPSSIASKNSIGSFFDMTVNCFFTNNDNKFINLNETALDFCGCSNTHDSLGSTVEKFCDKKFASKILKNNCSIMDNHAKQVVEEDGNMLDDRYLDVITLKLPWYYEKKIIGVFGIGIQNESVRSAITSFNRLMESGLLGNAQIEKIISHQSLELNGTLLTKREKNIAELVVRGKTAKETGEILYISKRTVEHYIDRLKYKLKAPTKAALIGILADAND